MNGNVVKWSQIVIVIGIVISLGAVVFAVGEISAQVTQNEKDIQSDRLVNRATRSRVGMSEARQDVFNERTVGIKEDIEKLSDQIGTVNSTLHLILLNQQRENRE